MKNQKGITLIALVITIIVLLILAGVSIAMLTGDNGILTQANKSTVTNIEARVDEEVKLAVQAARLVIENERAKDYSWSALANASTVIKDKMEDDLTTGYSIAATDGNATMTIKYTGSDYQKATNNASASITYTLTISQGEVTINGNPTFVPAH